MRNERDCLPASGACRDASDAIQMPSTNSDVAAWGYPVAEDSGARTARLVRSVEAEILPRLVMMRGTRVRRELASRDVLRPFTDDQDVTELTRLLLAHDVTVAWAFIEAVQQRGIPMQQICLELLAPAARRLGVMWEQDECDFMQVTLGLCRLHQALHKLNAAYRIPDDNQSEEYARRALIAPMPGEQHTFGVVMVSQFLRVAGWTVCNEFPQDNQELLEMVRDSWFAVVGLSVGSEVRLPSVSKAIAAIRSASRNKAICVLIGGPIFVKQPELARAVGADATAADGKIAVQIVETMFAALLAQR